MRYATVWISDLHLGTRGCDARGLLDFLRVTECERLYLVGDVLDLWQLRRQHYWPQTHSDVIQKILRKARKGTHVIWIPGNHDEFCQNFWGVYGNVIIKNHDVYTTAEGRRLLVLHGHEFDSVTTHARWLAHLGDKGYGLLLAANRPLNAIRTRFGLGYWSLSAYVKHRVKNAVSFISQFEDAVARYAAQHRVDGVVCGHIHTPAVRRIRNLDYYNTGDWVESSTALVEHLDGRMELLRWRRQAEATSQTPELELASVGEP
jgi:UDP-2,3-diacylglucosamine pyrophosphatase LpxH